MKKTIITICLLVSLLFFGCSDTPRVAAAKSEEYYHKALRGYKGILAKNKNSPQIKLELAKLYYNHGDFSDALKFLDAPGAQEAQKLRAYCFFKTSNYTMALEIFDRLGKLNDPEYLYYYGRTCQKQNLFEQAIDILSGIKSGNFSRLAKGQIEDIMGASEKFLESIEGIPAEKMAGFKEKILKASEENYPLAGAVILLADEKVEIFPDNTMASEAHFVIKILNERGKKSFSEIDIGYDSTYENVTVEYARTIKPSGEVVVVGQKDIRDVSRYLNFPLYSNARARIISMPEITEGAIVDYKVKTLSSQLINKKDFNSAYSLQESEPVILAKFEVILPKARDLKVKAINEEYNFKKFDLNPKVSEEANKKIYRWQFEDVPQIEQEAMMPPESEINPIILLSTFDSWGEIYKWWIGLAKDRIPADEAIKEKALELISNKPTQEEKIRSIYNYCAQSIRYVGVEYGQAGYQPHKASEIFKNKYGDCKDKAVLFISMMKACGLEAFPVLIGTRGTPSLEEDFPAALFNHAIAAVELGGKLIFLDITAEVCPFGDLPEDDQQRRVLVFKPDKYEIFQIPLFAPDKNRVEYKTDIKLDSLENIFCLRKVSTFGQFDQGQRFLLRYTPENLVEQGIKEKIQDIALSGKLIKYNYENRDDLNQPIRLVYEFEGKNFLSSAGPARILPQFGRVDTSIVAKDKRDYPLELGLPAENISLINIMLPDSLSIKYVPENIENRTQWMDYSISYDLENNYLRIRQKQVLKTRQVPQKDYADFKKFLEELAISLNQHVVLEKKN